MRLLPHDASFFEHFEEQGRKTVEGCRAFLEMVESGRGLEAQAERVKRIEHECDEITHAVVAGLHKTFITRSIGTTSIGSSLGWTTSWTSWRRRPIGWRSTRSPQMTQEVGDFGPRASSPARSTSWAPSEHPQSQMPTAFSQHCIEINRLENVGRRHPSRRSARCSATKRTRSPSSSGRRSTRLWRRPPTDARMSRTSSRASS